MKYLLTFIPALATWKGRPKGNNMISSYEKSWDIYDEKVTYTFPRLTARPVLVTCPKGHRGSFLAGADRGQEIGLARGFRYGQDAGYLEGWTDGKYEGYEAGYDTAMETQTPKAYRVGKKHGRRQGFNDALIYLYRRIKYRRGNREKLPDYMGGTDIPEKEFAFLNGFLAR